MASCCRPSGNWARGARASSGCCHWPWLRPLAGTTSESAVRCGCAAAGSGTWSPSLSSIVAAAALPRFLPVIPFCPAGGVPMACGAAAACAWRFCGAEGALARAAASAAACSGAGGSRRLSAARTACGCSAVGPTRSLAFATGPSYRSAGVSPFNTGETGDGQRDGRWRQFSRCGQPLESDIVISGSAVRQMQFSWCVPPRCAPRVTPPDPSCVSGVQRVMLCGARGWLEGPCCSPGGSGGSCHPCALAWETREQFGPLGVLDFPPVGRVQGPWTTGVWGGCRTEAHQEDPVYGGDLSAVREGVHLVPGLGGKGGQGTGSTPHGRP